MKLYDLSSFRLAVDDVAEAVVLEIFTIDGEQFALGMSGEGAGELAKAIHAFLEQHPEFAKWKTQKPQ